MRFLPPTSIASGLGSALDKPEPLKQTLKHHNSITQTQALNRANGQQGTETKKPRTHRNQEPTNQNPTQELTLKEPPKPHQPTLTHG